MNQLPNTIQTSDEIIKEAKELCKTNGENEPYFIIGYLKQHYDTLLESISPDKPNNQVHPVLRDIINNSFKI